MNLDDIPSARLMGTKLGSLSRLLFEEKLIQSRSKDFIDDVSKKLKALKQEKSWEYTIEESNAIKFVPIKDKKLGQIAPRIYIQVAVKAPGNNGISPFTRLNSTIEVLSLKDELQSRWHIDLANRNGTFQAGPLFHLQGGGHKPKGDRQTELKVSLPRWDIPPMELILTCERVLANFYPNQWKEIRYSFSEK